MTSRNNPNRQVQGAPRHPLDGIGGHIPLINPNAVNPNAPTTAEITSSGELPDPGWTPGGAMMAVQIVPEAGPAKEGDIVVPDTSTWRSKVLVVLAVGPECKYFRRGDHAVAPPNLEGPVIRFGGVSSFFVHEQQCFGYVNSVREALEKTEKSPPEPEPAHDEGGEAGGA